MLSLYIVRHGQTLFNVKRKIQGWCDSPLTKEGISQAKNVGKSLKYIPFEACYCSTSERVIDTATYIINDRNIPMIPTKRLKEMNFGEIEGESEKLLVQYQDLLVSKGMDKFGGETMKQVASRMYDMINEIKDKHSDGNILVVSHGGSILTLLCMIDESVKEVLMSKDSRGLENCSVSILDYINGEWKVREYNNTTYRDLK